MPAQDPAAPPPPAAERPVLTRRRLLLGAAATAAVTACAPTGAPTSSPTGGATGSTATSRPSAGSTAGTTGPAPAGAPPGTASTAPPGTAPTPEASCLLTPELTAGPYYLEQPLVRRDITEGRPGTPLDLTIRVQSADCAPLAGVAVDIWHCDAGGEYSGFNGNSLAATQAGGTNDKRYLRGVQVTDAEGLVRFTTIVPGWYEGRAVHIHLSVHVGGDAGTTFQGGHVAHTGQLFFDEALVTQVLATGAYRAHTGTRTTNAQDSIFRQAGPGAIAALTGAPDTGYRGTASCSIDPAATPPPAPLF